MKRLVLGAIAGTVATMAMTMAMRRLHHRLPDPERYPLPPREIIESIARAVPGARLGSILADATVLAHFAYGAGAGALFSVLIPRRSAVWGALYGVGVWGLSYLGWIPGARILESADRHPAPRNLLMLAVHVVWGGSLALALRELEASERDIFRTGPARDARSQAGPGRLRPEIGCPPEIGRRLGSSRP